MGMDQRDGNREALPLTNIGDCAVMACYLYSLFLLVPFLLRYPEPLDRSCVFSVQPAMQPYMVLAERIGKMQAQISSSKVRGVW